MKKVIKFILIIVFFILLIGSNNFVSAAEDIEIKIFSNNTEWTTSNVMLIIDISTNKVFDSESKQAVQILLGDESTTNKWVDLGSDTNGLALKKSYTYIVKNSAIVSVRVVTWKLENKSDLEQLAIQTYDVSNIDKTNPVIEKIETNISNNSIDLNVIAKDSDSGIEKYICKCEEISYNQTSEISEFKISNLKENKKYTFEIIVQDKLGNKTTTTKKITTKPKENENTQNVANNTIKNTNTTRNPNTTSNTNTNISINNTNVDNTIANKIIPQIGKSQFLLAIILVLAIGIIIKRTKDRM